MAMARDHQGPRPSDGPSGRPAPGGERAAPEFAAALGGWRPANLAAGPARAQSGDPGRPALSALRPGVIEATPIESRFDRSKESLAGLFALRPPRPVGHVADRGDVQSWHLRIETERLVLQVPDLAELAEIAAMLADPETFRYSERGSMSEDEATDRLLRNVGHWALMGWGMFAIEEKSSGRFVGEAGFGDFRRRLGARYDGMPEAAWTVASWAQGNGYATEAMRAALLWLEATLKPARTVCFIHGGNTPSLRVADKLGYVPFDTCRHRGYPALMFERPGR